MEAARRELFNYTKELESRMINDAPEIVKQFHREHPPVPHRLSSTEFDSLKFTEPVYKSLPTEQELLHISVSIKRANGVTYLYQQLSQLKV